MDHATTVLNTATEVLKAVPDTGGGTQGWWAIALVAVGALAYKLISWIASWIDGKGKAWIDERLQKLQEQINQNSVLAQIQADDAVIKILQDSIPEVLQEISDTAKQDLKDGKFDKVDWDGIGGKLWLTVKPHVIGGANDYLKQSSFEDGKLLASWVVQKFFKKQQAKAEGLING